MPHYLLSVHTTIDPADVPSGPPPSPEDMAAMMERINTLEDDLESSGAWVFSGRLSDPDSAAVVQHADGAPMITDGPFAESKEHMAGFYLIAADDGDAALAWADKVSACVGQPIEVRAFAGTGRARDHVPPGDD